MSNETVYKYGTQRTVISGTANLASNGFNGSAECSNTPYNSALHSNYPLADAVLFASFSTSVSSASNVVNLYRRDLNIDGANNAPQPQSASPAYSNTWVGAFVIPPFTAASSGYFPLNDVPLSAQCEFYIEDATNATILGTASSYTVKLTPKTYGPAP
jgi:hypothetical protein